MTLRALDALKSEPWFLSNGVRSVFEALDGNEDATRIVGGAVRNALLGLPVTDIDFATRIRPDAVMDRIASTGGRAIPTGMDHGTITAVVEGQSFEITTLRKDVETDGRHAKVSFANSFEEDARRRDFTINALAIAANGIVHDPVEGLQDLERRRLKFIGDPDARIREDYLRILRFFRFFAFYGSEPPDADTEQAVIGNRDGLKQLSKERIGSEIVRLAQAPDPNGSMRLMNDWGISELVLGGGWHIEAVAALIDVERSRGLSGSSLRRLAAGVGVSPALTEKLRSNLRLPNSDRDHLNRVDRALELLEANPQGQREAIHRCGLMPAIDAVIIHASRTGQIISDSVWELLNNWEPPPFPISGNDLKTRGMSEGREMGEALREAEDAWIKSDFQASADDLLKRIFGTSK